MLTQKQENFCLAYIETGNASEAYRRAYTATGMSAATVNRKAKELMDNGKISARIENLRKPAAKAAQFTLEQHLSDLKRLRDKAEQDGKYGPAIQAEIARGKAAGHYTEKIEHSGIVTQILPEAPKLTKDEWLKAHGLGSLVGGNVGKS